MINFKAAALGILATIALGLVSQLSTDPVEFWLGALTAGTVYLIVDDNN